MLRRLLAASLALAAATALIAAPVKSGSDTVTDRAGYIPIRKQQSLAGKVVGVLVTLWVATAVLYPRLRRAAGWSSSRPHAASARSTFTRGFLKTTSFS